MMKKDITRKTVGNLWIIHGGAMFLFAGLAGIFFLMGGGTGSKDDEETTSSSSLSIDDLPDAYVEEVADSRLEAYNRATALYDQEEKERAKQAEHNSFHFFAEEVESNDSLNEDDQTETDDHNVAELRKFQQVTNSTSYPTTTASVGNGEKESHPDIRNTAMKSPNCQSAGKKSSVADDEETEWERNREREKKERLKRLKALYYGDEEEEKQEEEKVENPMVVQSEKKPINGFKPMKENKQNSSDGSIRAVIHGEQKNITSSSQVVLRLLDPIEIDGVNIPRNTTIIGMASFHTNRVMINIENIAYNNNVYPFRGTIYDQDGFQGIYFPDNLVNDAKKEAGSETVSSAEVNLNGLRGMVNTGVNALVNATKDVVSGSMRETKITLPANYKLIIKTKS